MTEELSNLNAAFDLTESGSSRYSVTDLHKISHALLYLIEDDDSFSVNIENDNIAELVGYFRQTLKEKNLYIHRITKQSYSIEKEFGKDAARSYLVDQSNKTTSRFVRQILAGFVNATGRV